MVLTICARVRGVPASGGSKYPQRMAKELVAVNLLSLYVDRPPPRDCVQNRVLEVNCFDNFIH